MKNMKSFKGITLISLSITISVLLILATLIISRISEEKIVEKAEDAKKEYEDKSQKLNAIMSEYDEDTINQVVKKVLLGDINNDGSVNGMDSQKLKTYLSEGNISINKASADTDRDKKITKNDKIMLSKYLSGGINSTFINTMVIDNSYEIETVYYEKVRLGDLDNDGRAYNGADLNRLKGFLQGTLEINKAAADINQDKKINQDDVDNMSNIILGIQEEGPEYVIDDSEDIKAILDDGTIK